MLYGVLHLSLWGYFVATMILTQITIFSVTIFLHRCQSHRALTLHPIASHFFRFWLWLTTGMVTKEWVAIHRKHHAKTETPDDPHSPQVKGIKKVLLEGAELYREASKEQETMDKYGHGTPDDWIERRIYTPYSQMGITLMFILDLVLFGLPGITIWAIQMIWIPLFAAGVINGIGHYFGYRNYECADASRNIVPWAIFVGGEELHNNHHTFASSAKLSSKWWEFDIGWFVIRAMSFVGLAKVKKTPPSLAYAPEKTAVDMDTLRAVFANRFQVMSNYTKQVILPVWREQKRQAHGKGAKMLRKAKQALMHEPHVLPQKARATLTSVLDKYKELRVVYQYRAKLQALWSRTAASQRELLEALQAWCQQAEATGNAALQQFALNMRAYVMGPKFTSA